MIQLDDLAEVVRQLQRLGVDACHEFVYDDEPHPPWLLRLPFPLSPVIIPEQWRARDSFILSG